MAKPESWRLSPEAYSFITTMDTRFQDIDTMGHINNVAISGIFETARIRFHHHLGRHPQEQGVRWLVAAVSLNFVEESHFPYPLEVHRPYRPHQLDRQLRCLPEGRLRRHLRHHSRHPWFGRPPRHRRQPARSDGTQFPAQACLIAATPAQAGGSRG